VDLILSSAGRSMSHRFDIEARKFGSSGKSVGDFGLG
jgi:hypothetical protein